MANYAWTPFESKQAWLMASNLERTNKIEVVEDLKSLKFDDVLYISAHGGKGMETIGFEEIEPFSKKAVPGSKVILSPEELATKLENEGLKKNHFTIKLWVCYGGCGAEEQKGFAYKFWEAMHQKGYNDLNVIAYTEMTVDPTNSTSKTCIDELKKPLPGTAKDYRVAILGSGDFVGQDVLKRG